MLPKAAFLQIPRTAYLPNQWDPSAGPFPEGQFTLPWAFELPTCLGSSELHQSLCWQPCTSGRAPASPPRKAVWGNATGWLSQRFGVPAGVSAAGEAKKERTSKKKKKKNISHKYQIFKTAQQKGNLKQILNSWLIFKAGQYFSRVTFSRQIYCV